ncbi:nodulation protein NfeD [bacterium]|nr:nodulation protein NfeD [bacterium]
MTYFFCILFVLCSLPVSAATVQWMKLDGAVGPVADELLQQSLEDAEQSGAEALVIELDTPGGLLKTTRIMCKRIMSAKVPVVMYVSPSGARAGSAGVFLTLASHVAVMAPGTNIGAAHPVGLGGMGGADSSHVMEDKVTNDAAAFARSLADKYGRNAEWAERAVRESESVTEKEALGLNAIDFVVSSRDSLLILLHGRVVQLESGPDTLNTESASIVETEIGWRLRVLDTLSDPNIAYIFLLLGIYGLFFELYNPGAIIPGVVGAVSILLAVFSLQLLPISWTGLLLILLGVILFLLEIKVASYGVLSIGGVISMALGSLMLFEPFQTGIQVGLELVIPAAIITALFFLFVIGAGLRAQKRKVVTGAEGLVGETGTAFSALEPNGKVLVHGELWNAVASATLPKGAEVKVVAVSNMLLRVEPLTKPQH